MQTLKFEPSSAECQHVARPPVAAKNYIPDWFKNIKSVDRTKPQFNDQGMQINTNIKMCMPFLDTFTTGYIQETWCDIYINVGLDDNGNYTVDTGYPTGPDIISYRKKPTMLSISDEYFPIEFIWLEHWVPIAPNGYSILHTHPLNRLDLPFMSLSGIVDSDVYSHESAGAYPFFLKKEFNGKIIPAGTPMFQMIPVKRESWQSQPLEFNEVESMKKRQSIRKYIYDGYRNHFWQKKDYR